MPYIRGKCSSLITAKAIAVSPEAAFRTIRHVKFTGSHPSPFQCKNISLIKVTSKYKVTVNAQLGRDTSCHQICLLQCCSHATSSMLTEQISARGKLELKGICWTNLTLLFYSFARSFRNDLGAVSSHWIVGSAVPAHIYKWWSYFLPEVFALWHLPRG